MVINIKNFLVKNRKLVLIPVVLILAVLIIICINSFNNKKIQQQISLYEERFLIEQPTTNNQQVPKIIKRGDNYQAQNESFAVKIPAKSYQEPVEFERRNKKLVIAPDSSIIKTVKAMQNGNYLFYKNVFQSTDIIKKITLNGVIKV